MGQYTGELKMIKASVRITETMNNRVDSFEGADFSSKFRNLVEYCFDKVPALNNEIHSLLKEVDNLQKQRQELLQDIAKLQEAREKVSEVLHTLDKLSDMQHDFAGEMIERQYKNIAAMVEREGFRPTPAVLEQFRQLNAAAGKQHNLADICKAYREKSYAADKETEKLVKSIYEEFQSQELERRPAEMEQEEGSI